MSPSSAPSTVPERPRPLGALGFSLLAVGVGAVAALGAVVFRGLIGLFHNLLFLGQLSWSYDANLHTPPSPWGAGVILVPVVGAAGVAWIVQRFAPEARGHGVPEVMDAIYYGKGLIRPVVALVKALASALSIGSGGSVGREGPIIQIGSAFGSTVAQLLRVPAWQRITLIAAGAGGGIAATFNTPIGGVLFAVEIVMLEVSARTLVPVALAAASATYLGRVFFGSTPSFVIPALETPYFHLQSPWLLFAYVGLGLLIGAVAALYVRSIYVFEHFFESRIRGGYVLRHMLGMLGVGVTIYALFAVTGRYYVEGVGYSTVQDVLAGHLVALNLLLTLFVLKLLATALTLGSGASGGVFSPALYLGATLGAAYGLIAQQLVPALDISPAAFAVAGMAGVVGASTGAAMAAIVMIFEMTLDYNVVIPMTLTVALSYGVRRVLCRESIYTMKLARRGHPVPEALQINLHQARCASDLMDTHFATLPADATLGDASRTFAERGDVSWLVVERVGHVAGVLTRAAALAALGERGPKGALGESAARPYLVVPERISVIDILALMRVRMASLLLVTSGFGAAESAPATNDVRGLVTKEHIADLMARTSEFFADQ